MKPPDCYKCKFRRNIPGDCHSGCVNHVATVTGNPYGIREGWFSWPFNFDPIGLKHATDLNRCQNEEMGMFFTATRAGSAMFRDADQNDQTPQGTADSVTADSAASSSALLRPGVLRITGIPVIAER
jgi:hypothetical protein